MLGTRNSFQVDDFCTRGRHENLEVYYNSQTYCGLPRQSIGTNFDRMILFKQTLGDIQTIYYDIGAHDKLYSDFKEICLTKWVKYLTILVFIWLKTKMKVNVVFSMKAKTHILNAFVKVNFFD